MTQPLLRVRHLRKDFNSFRALHDISFDICAGESFALIGESGSGKTTAARCILRALQPTAGKIEFTKNNQTIDLASIPDRALKPLRRDMQMVFQDPFASLNPRMTVGDIVAEPLLIHRLGSRTERREQVAAILERVGLSPTQMSRYPHALSGGQRQRVGIARALVLRPTFVVLDEAVSALDVSVQAQVLALLKELHREMNLTYLFVSHNLAVVSHFCDRVAVMFRGRIVELGETSQVLTSPKHAYTRVLLSAVPSLDPDRRMNPLSVSDLTEEQLAESHGILTE